MSLNKLRTTISFFLRFNSTLFQENPVLSAMNVLNNGIHYKKGSPEPNFPNDGKLRLYSMRFCPYAARAHLVLNIKKIPYHVAYVDLHEKPEWLTKYSPLGKVPALVIPGQPEPLIESLVISDYLDEQYPEPALYPRDPLGKAKDRIFVERFNAISWPIIKILISGGSDDFEKEIQLVSQFFEFIDQEYVKRNTKFFFGNSNPGMVDFMIWPWIEKLPLAVKKAGKKLDVKSYQNLAKWEKYMLEEDAVKGFYVSPEDSETFLTARAKGEPPYNLLAGKL